MQMLLKLLCNVVLNGNVLEGNFYQKKKFKNWKKKSKESFEKGHNLFGIIGIYLE